MKQHDFHRTTCCVFGLTAVTLAASLPRGLAASPSGDPPAKASTTDSHEAMQQLPRLQPKRVVTVTGNENWDELRGFGKDAAMVAMMTLMMVGGSGMEHMKMAPMKKGGMSMAGMDMGVGSNQPWGQAAGPKVTLNTPADTLKVGKNALDFTLLDAAGKPVTGAKITTSVAMTSMDMGTTHPQAREGKDGHYTTEAEFSMMGPWRVVLTVAPPNGKPLTRSFDLQVTK